MVKAASIQKWALALPGVTEEPHFEKTSFRVRGRIFVTLDADAQTIVLKLSLINQSIFCAHNSAVISPVEGAWGRKGWTRAHLRGLETKMAKALVTTAYGDTANASQKTGREG